MDFDELKNTIIAETTKAKEELAEKLVDPKIKNVGCLDKKAVFKGDWNPPGGAQLILDLGRLEEWMGTKRAGVFGIHLGCAERFFVANKTTYAQQKQGIEEFQIKVVQLNQKLGTDFRVVIDQDGSAKEYLK